MLTPEERPGVEIATDDAAPHYLLNHFVWVPPTVDVQCRARCDLVHTMTAADLPILEISRSR